MRDGQVLKSIVLTIPILFFSFVCLGVQDLPDPKLTPGATLPVAAMDVCRPGYSAKVRNVPATIKTAVYKEYGMAADKVPCPCEVDHLISLELGGSNDPKNLWPEPYSGSLGAREKDKLENYLHRRVCNGKISLQDAQGAIKKDWVKAYHSANLDKIGNKGIITQGETQ